MSDLSFVLQRIAAGDKVRFFENFYGSQWIVLRWPWLPAIGRRIYFRNDEMAQIQAALIERRRRRKGMAPVGLERPPGAARSLAGNA